MSCCHVWLHETAVLHKLNLTINHDQILNKDKLTERTGAHALTLIKIAIVKLVPFFLCCGAR